ncbi:hypothetical protein [Sediminibacillus massiliensis]|uniref:hypothetical protein n=1 Tax=Sediminibacillus massiliensis TaxID=1926277 RepID=UPI0009882F41|nr:hypothetical protein [Sediminibacillus massiliensis]
MDATNETRNPLNEVQITELKNIADKRLSPYHKQILSRLIGEHSRLQRDRYSISEEKCIKVIASATKRVGGYTDGIIEIRIDDSINHKFLPAHQLKALAGAKRINQYKKIEGWLNTKEGREWALKTPHVTNF